MRFVIGDFRLPIFDLRFDQGTLQLSIRDYRF